MQTGCYARLSFSLPLSSLGSCRNGAPASRCDRLRDQRPRDHPAIMAGVRKVAKTGTAAASYSRTAAAVPGPLILAKEGQSPSPARAELAFHRTRDAPCRCSTRWPRGGLSRAGPCTPRRRTAMPPAGLAEWQGNGADDEQPSRRAGPGWRRRIRYAAASHGSHAGAVRRRRPGWKPVRCWSRCGSCQACSFKSPPGAVVPAAAGVWSSDAVITRR